MTTKITATMAAALAMAHEHGGKLVRHAGGYWTWEGCPRDCGRFLDWVGTPTVEGLVKRGRLEYSEFRDGSHGRFPVAAILTPDKEATDNG